MLNIDVRIYYPNHLNNRSPCHLNNRILLKYHTHHRFDSNPHINLLDSLNPQNLCKILYIRLYQLVQ